jgi:pimeloyl-ACP methyl ester carboxylesterase
VCGDRLTQIESARLTVISAGGHAFFDEKPFELNEVLLDFLTAL